jgi:hypothetical protein
LNEAVDAYTESLIDKMLDDTYKPSRQTHAFTAADYVQCPNCPVLQLIITMCPTSAQAFLNEAVDASTEGLIVKTLGDTYEPSRRSSHWLKLKKDYLAGVGDTFDVVPIGAFYGRGKRAGEWGWSSFTPISRSIHTLDNSNAGFAVSCWQQC